MILDTVNAALKAVAFVSTAVAFALALEWWMYL